MKPIIKLKATVPFRKPEKTVVFCEDITVKYRFFLGKIIKTGHTLQKFQEDQDILIYLPINSQFSSQNSSFSSQIQVEESLLIPIPDKIDHKEALIACSVALKLFNSLFQKGRFIEGESVMIIGLSYQYVYILLQLILSLNGTVFLVMNTTEEFDKIRSFIDQMSLNANTINLYLCSDPYFHQFIEKTHGLGVDIILDFLEIHKELKEIIGLLAPNGRWVVSDEKLQINPPEIKALLMRNASLGFGWEEVYGFFKYEIGKALNIIEQMMGFVVKGKVKIVMDYEYKSLEEWEKVEGFNEKKILGSIIVNLPEK